MKSKRSSLKFVVNSLRNESTKGSQKLPGVGPIRANPFFLVVSILTDFSDFFPPAASGLSPVRFRTAFLVRVWSRTSRGGIPAPVNGTAR